LQAYTEIKLACTCIHTLLQLTLFCPPLWSCSSVSITVTDSSGKAVQTVCPGQSYTIGVEFPDKRFAYVSLSSGAFQKESINIKRCGCTWVLLLPQPLQL
jgi:hypothetical protein